jgi:hypothetical protein
VAVGAEAVQPDHGGGRVGPCLQFNRIHVEQCSNAEIGL